MKDWRLSFACLKEMKDPSRRDLVVRPLIAAVIVVIGVITSAAMTKVISDPRWSILTGAAILGAAVMGASIYLKTVIPGLFLAAAIFISAGLVDSKAEWSELCSSVGGVAGVFVVIASSQQQNKTSWPLIIGSAILAAALIIAVLT